MVFCFYVEFYDEFENRNKEVRGFIVGENFSETLNTLVKYYGEDAIEKVELEIFGPDAFLVFEEEDTDIFNTVKEHLKEKIIW